jgi:hypothetical protein
MSQEDVEEVLLTYRETAKHLPPPVESWAELRERARKLATNYRASPRRRSPHRKAQAPESDTPLPLHQSSRP